MRGQQQNKLNNFKKVVDKVINLLYNKNVIDVINYLVIMLFKVTPVSIPNTKVKLLEADGTAWETVWESKWLPG